MFPISRQIWYVVMFVLLQLTSVYKYTKHIAQHCLALFTYFTIQFNNTSKKKIHHTNFTCFNICLFVALFWWAKLRIVFHWSTSYCVFFLSSTILFYFLLLLLLLLSLIRKKLFSECNFGFYQGTIDHAERIFFPLYLHN